MDVIDFLKSEHRKAKAAFAEMLDAAPTKRGGMWTALQPELKAHEAFEEANLYGPLEQEGPADPVLSEWVSDRHGDEVDEVEALIEDTERLDPMEDRWLETVQKIHAALEGHIRQEEGDIFPRIAEVWDRAKREKAGEKGPERR